MTKKQLVPAILNLFTLVGGHLYNRQPQRALLFMALILTCYFAAFVFIFLYFATTPPEESPSVQIDKVRLTASAVFIGSLFIYFISAVTAYRDERQPGPPGTKRVWSSIFSATILSVFGVGLITYQAFAAYAFNVQFRDAFSEHSSQTGAKSDNKNLSLRMGSSTDRFFLNGTAFKRYDASFHDPDLPDPPAGAAQLTGEFHLDGKAIPDLTFDMVLDGKYRAKNIATDSNGLFSIPIQPGTWHIDYVHITAWNNKPPDRNLMLLNGREGKLSEDFYDSSSYFNYGEGVPVTATLPAEDRALIAFSIVDKLKMLEPDEQAGRQEVSSDQFAIRWQAYPDAKTYLVRLNKIKRKASQISYTPVVKRRITNATQLPLSDLKTVPHEGENLEYQVRIFAFDEQGNFLSESEDVFDSYSIVLADGKEIVEDNFLEMFVGSGEQPSMKDMEEYRNNEQRLEAAKTLIKDKLFNEAHALLDKVQGRSKPGEKDAITGYLLAEQNQCAEAEKYFEKAKQASSNSCVPDCYRKNCAK